MAFRSELCILMMMIIKPFYLILTSPLQRPFQVTILLSSLVKPITFPHDHIPPERLTMQSRNLFQSLPLQRAGIDLPFNLVLEVVELLVKV